MEGRRYRRMSWLGDVKRPEVEVRRNEIMQGRNVPDEYDFIITMADAEADTDEKVGGEGFGETLGSQAQCFDRMRRHCMGLTGWLTAW
jgi:hypothetical protein